MDELIENPAINGGIAASIPFNSPCFLRHLQENQKKRLQYLWALAADYGAVTTSAAVTAVLFASSLSRFVFVASAIAPM